MRKNNPGFTGLNLSRRSSAVAGRRKRGFGIPFVSLMAAITGQIKDRFKFQSGMTLFEVLMALTLTGLSGAVLAASFAQSAHTRRLLEGRVTAQILGIGKIAEIINGSELGNSDYFPEPYRKYRWIAREEELENGLTAILLTVEWSRGNEKFQKTLVGYKESGK
ncbi:MAG: hypothetical protein GX075_05900 [Firmicutes bacterium]|nr:hypothetical protein [Bacillota bacterium]